MANDESIRLQKFEGIILYIAFLISFAAIQIAALNFVLFGKNILEETLNKNQKGVDGDKGENKPQYIFYVFGADILSLWSGACVQKAFWGCYAQFSYKGMLCIMINDFLALGDKLVTDQNNYFELIQNDLLLLSSFILFSCVVATVISGCQSIYINKSDL